MMNKETTAIKPHLLNTPGVIPSAETTSAGRLRSAAEGTPTGHSPPSSLRPEQRKALDRIALEITFLMGLLGVLIVVALIVIMILLG